MGEAQGLCKRAREFRNMVADRIEMTPAQAAQQDRLLHEMHELNNGRSLEDVIKILGCVNAAIKRARERGTAEVFWVR